MQTLDLPTLPARDPAAHKGDLGSVLVVAGSLSYPGAAILATLGAGRAGAGLVHLAVPETIAPLVLPAVPFAVLHPLPDEGSGDACADLAREAAGRCDAVVLGPGLGTSARARRLVSRLLDDLQCPLLLDADGLNLAVELGVERLATRPGPTVLTPHPGEFARLDGGPIPAAEERVERATALATTLGVVVVLKGQNTVVTDGERVSVEAAGNPGMATGGMGDVLAGFGGTLLASLPEAAGAAALAVHLHALAGDLAAAELGCESVLPGDVAERFGRALQRHRAGR